VNKFLGLCLENKWLKLLSLALAVVIWVLVSRTLSSTKTLRVALVLHTPADVFILERRSREIQVTVEGPRPAMDRLLADTSKLRVEIDLERKLGNDLPKDFEAPHVVNVPIVPSDIRNLPPEITVVERKLRPDSVPVKLDEIISKRLAVEPDFHGSVKEGFQMYQFYVQPREVDVRGPRSVLSQRETISTEPIRIDGLERLWKPQPPLDRSDKRAGLADCLDPDPPTVEVWIEVVPIEEKRIVRNVPIEVRGLSGFHYILLNTELTEPYDEIPEVEVRGPQNLLANLKLRAFVDLTDVTDPREHPQEQRPVQFDVDPALEVLSKLPPVVVQIKAETPE